MKLLYALIALLASRAGFGTESRADVSWNLIITQSDACFVAMGGPLCQPDLPLVPINVPRIDGTLTVSDADFLKGGISFSANNGSHPLLVQGDTDWSFTFAEDPNLNLPGFSCSSSNTNLALFCDADVAITIDPSGLLTGHIFAVTTGTLHLLFSDDTLTPGQSWTGDEFNRVYQFSHSLEGHWELASNLTIPEPSSLLLLISALAVLGVVSLHSSDRATEILCGSGTDIARA